MAGASLNKWMDESRKLQWDRHMIAKKAEEVAAYFLSKITSFARGEDKKTQSLLHAWAKDEVARQFTLRLLKEVYSYADAGKADERLEQLIEEYKGIPACFGRMASIKVSYLSFLSKGKAASLQSALSGSFGSLYIDASGNGFDVALRDDVKEGLSSSVRLMSPPSLGKQSSLRYQQSILEQLSSDKRFAVEVDIRALCYSFNFYHLEQSIARLKDLLQVLFEASAQSEGKHPLVLTQLSSQSLPLVVAALKALLRQKKFDQIDLCLELPAYLPCVKGIISDLAAWGTKRCAAKKNSTVFRSALKIRLIKGENIDEERLTILRNRRNESISTSKVETEARFKNLLHELIKSTSLELIVGTHNLFDIAYAILLWKRSRRAGEPNFVLLRGMGLALARFLRSNGFGVSLQSCLYSKENASLAYEGFAQLVADISQSNSLIALPFGTLSSSAEWVDFAQKFAMTIVKMESLEDKSPCLPANSLLPLQESTARSQLLQSLEKECSTPVGHISQDLEGKAIVSKLKVNVRDLYSRQIEYSFDSLMHEHAARILDQAKKALSKVEKTVAKRSAVVEKLGQILSEKRTSLIALLVRDAGYSLEDADKELCQAIGYCNSYSAAINEAGWRDGSQVEKLGLVVVSSKPQNPLASAVEGIVSAWIAGSIIIYHPATTSVRLALGLKESLAEAGIGEPYLKLALCLDNQIADIFMNDPSVVLKFPAEQRFVVDDKTTAPTAQRTITSPEGLCSVLIAADAPWRRALLENIKSFAQRSGQLCSTPHVLIIEAALYDSPLFWEQLRDLVDSLELGDARQLQGEMGPQSAPMDIASRNALGTLAEGESYLLNAPIGEELASACCPLIVRMGVSLASPILQYQAAAKLPHLSIMRAKDMQEGLEIQRQISYHYRAGIYSPSDSDIAHWRKHLPLSQAFINTPPEPCQPGLIAEGQLNMSVAASGGNMYVPALCQWSGKARPQLRSDKCQIPFTPWDMIKPRPTGEAMMRLRAAADSISHWWEKEFGILHQVDESAGMKIELRYEAAPVCIRAEKDMSDVDLCILLLVALKACSRVDLSLGSERSWALGRLESMDVSIYRESREDFEERLLEISDKQVRVRDVGATDATRMAARSAGVYLSSEAVVANGRIELMRICRERGVTSCGV